MKRITPTLLAISCLVFSPEGNAQPVEAVTVPVGVLTISVRGGNATTPPTQLLGLGMTKAPSFSSKVASVSTANGTQGQITQLNFAVGTFAPTILGSTQGVGSHYVEIVGGAADGVISHVESTAADTIVLQDLVSGLGGDFTIRVRPFETVQGAFGAANQAGFLGAASSSAADIIRVLLPGASPVEVFYNTSAGQWQFVGGGTAANQPIYPDGGIEVVRRGTAPFNFTVLGEVKTGPTSLIVEGGTGDKTSSFQNPYPLKSVRLKDLGLYTGNATTGVKEGTSAANADVVTIEDVSTGVKNQFFVDSASKRWRVGFTDASLIQIPENASISITRRSGGAPFSWKNPQPVMALGTGPLPLTLVAASSRKTHGAAGTWDVNLPLAGTLVGIEPRTGGSSNNHTVVFTFEGASASNPIVSGNASITGGTASIASTQFIGNEMIVNLTGAANQQTVTVGVTNIAAQNGQTVAGAQASIGLLFGDINYNRSVNAADIAQTKISSGFFRLDNFRTDVNANGSINAADIAQTKVNSGKSL
jgi:hypothetical protein